MKVFCGVLVGLLCASGCLSQATDDQQRRAILGLLPAEVLLANVEPPGNNASACQGLWRSQGFGCNETRLKAFADEDLRRMQQFQTESQQLLANLRKTLILAAPLLAELSPLNKTNIDKFVHETTIARLEEESSRCWNATHRLRNAALCTICSAQNFRYFKDGKAVITPRACNFMLDSGCQGHFASLVAVGPIIRPALEIIITKTGIQAELERINAFEQSRGNRDLRELLNKKMNATNPEEMEAIGAQICERTLSLTDAPILYRFVKSMSMTIDCLMKAVTGYRSQQPSRQTSMSNWRYLQNSLLGNPGMSFDDTQVIVLMPIDNMFTSFVGAPGSNGNPFMQPMNLSLVFP